MPQPIWRKIVSNATVPEPNTQWVLALDYLTAGKVMMIEVNGTWRPYGFKSDCSADGDFDGSLHADQPQTGSPLVANAPIGALIARIGGSTTDQKFDTGITLSPIAFSIGRKCVFLVPGAPTGSLFLGVNDDPSRMALVTGNLLINIYEAV